MAKIQASTEGFMKGSVHCSVFQDMGHCYRARTWVLESSVVSQVTPKLMRTLSAVSVCHDCLLNEWMRLNWSQPFPLQRNYLSWNTVIGLSGLKAREGLQWQTCGNREIGTLPAAVGLCLCFLQATQWVRNLSKFNPLEWPLLNRLPVSKPGYADKLDLYCL